MKDADQAASLHVPFCELNSLSQYLDIQGTEIANSLDFDDEITINLSEDKAYLLEFETKFNADVEYSFNAFQYADGSMQEVNGQESSRSAYSYISGVEDVVKISCQQLDVQNITFVKALELQTISD
jgi:hypothetical protein